MTGAFSLPAPGDAGVRRAALAIHAAHPADRGWLLEQVGRADRAALERMLAELEGLGIPRDPTLVRSVLAGRGPDLEALRAAGAAALARLLQPEPAQLCAQVLRQLGGAYGAHVLGHMAAPQRREVEAALASLPQEVPHALCQAALREFAQRLPGVQPLTVWGRLVRRFARGGEAA